MALIEPSKSYHYTSLHPLNFGKNRYDFLQQNQSQILDCDNGLVNVLKNSRKHSRNIANKGRLNLKTTDESMVSVPSPPFSDFLCASLNPW